MNDTDEKLFLAVRCIGLNVQPKTVFQNIGLFNSIYVRATAQATSRNEKRYIKIAQSDPFKPSGRPSNYNFAAVYNSEIFDEISDISPSLLAIINCPREMDCKIRLSVYYSSSLTGGKDVMLAATTFSKRELEREVLSVSGYLTSIMNSEHCPGAKAYIEIVPKLPPILSDQSWNVTADENKKNPLVQHYVYYNEIDTMSHVIDVEELSWEPRHSFNICIQFLRNFLDSLERSINSWTLRLELERMRQGRFTSLSAALINGWHLVKINVVAARIGSNRTSTVNENTSTAFARASSAGGNNMNANNNNPLPIYHVAIPNLTSLSTQPITNTSQKTVKSNHQVKVKKLDETAPHTFVEISIEDRHQPFLCPIGRTNTEYNTLNPFYGSNLNTAIAKKNANSSAVLEDETAQLTSHVKDFSFTLVETLDRDSYMISGLISNQMMTSNQNGVSSSNQSTSIGLSSSNSNLNLSTQNLACIEENKDLQEPNNLESADTVQSTANLSSNVQNVSSLSGYTKKSSKSGSHESNSSGDKSSKSNLSGIPQVEDSVSQISITGKEFSFLKYVPSCHYTSVRFDFCLEDGHSPNSFTRVGFCNLPLLANGDEKLIWIRVIPYSFQDESISHASGYQNAAASLDDIELCVSVSTTSPNAVHTTGMRETEIKTSSSSTKELNQNASSLADNFKIFINDELNTPVATLSDNQPSIATNISAPLCTPAKMSEAFLYDRDANGFPTLISTPEIEKVTSDPNQLEIGTKKIVHKKKQQSIIQAMYDYRANISDSYEWLWHLGFRGVDPLLFISDPKKLLSNRDSTKQSANEINKKVKDSATHQKATKPQVERSTSSSGANKTWDQSELRHIKSKQQIIASKHQASEKKKEKKTPTFSIVDSDDEVEVDFESLEGREVIEESSEQSKDTSNKPLETIYQHEALLDGNPGSGADFGIEPAEIYRSRTTLFENQMYNDVEDRSENPDIDQSSSIASGQEGQLSPKTERSTVPWTGICMDQSFRYSFDHVKSISFNSTTEGKQMSISEAANNLFLQPYQVRPRIDFPYDLNWIKGYIQELQAIALELQSVLSSIEERHRTQKVFRPSTMKKVLEVQALPTNLHYQLMGIRKHSQPRSRLDVVASTTCGAPTPHALGQKKGGLFLMEENLISKKENIEKLKLLLYFIMDTNTGNCLPRKANQMQHIKMLSPKMQFDHSGSLSNSNGMSSAFALMNEIGSKTMQYESECLRVSHRRIYSISQCLSVAVNSVILNLALAADGHIPHIIAELWLKNGFLIVFEGLLSVFGNERSMLEDTMSAVEALKVYQIRIVLNENEVSDNKSTGFDNSENPSLEKNNDMEFQREVIVEIIGREVLLKLSKWAVSKLPEEYRSLIWAGTGAKLRLYSVLFTQGIDIQQTVATAFGSTSSTEYVFQSGTNASGLHSVNGNHGKINNIDLQRFVNLKSLHDLNVFCMNTQPVNYFANQQQATGSESDKWRSQIQIHPIVQQLHDTIMQSSLTLKNVDLLVEVERVCLLLGGCRVTFCKSGKDRTGMAVTLEQSRQLGERFGCGVSLNRILKDANLMRVHGCRIMVAEKNIGRKVYSINKIQAQFLPVMFRPPPETWEDIMKKDNS